MQNFVDYEEIQDVLSHGETKSSVRLRNGLQVDIRIAQKKSMGAAKLHFTGSKAHTVALRKMAKELFKKELYKSLAWLEKEEIQLLYPVVTKNNDQLMQESYP